MKEATQKKEALPIPEQMWRELAELDERISIRISAALADHKNQIVCIGESHGLTEQELRDRGILIMTSLGTATAGQAARRS